LRDLELPGRSPVHATEGMVATSHPLATQAALRVLQDGGNAMDAAVAAVAVQCVVEPQSTGIGGDCFVLYAPGGSDRVIGFNGSGRAPAAARAEWFAERGIAAIEQTSPHAVTVPGAVDAWDRLLRDHGTRDLGSLLRPAIRYARHGYPVHSRVFYDWALSVELLNRDATAKRIYLPGGHPPRIGSLHRQPELAATLERIAERGRAGFYEGPVAEDIVGYLRGLGGLHSLEDFAIAQGAYVTPIRSAYRGYEVHECPPNGQGLAALIMLNILSELLPQVSEPLSALRLHYEIEAARLAYRDRDDFIADPAQVEVPVEDLLSAAHAERCRAMIDPERALAELPPSRFPNHPDTVYLCVVDRDRNAVSLINSVYYGFGSGLVSPKTGVVLQNRGQSFNLDPGHPNCIAPGKRPMHTIIPGMVTKGRRVAMPFGVMGGMYQAQGHAHFLGNVFDFGLDLQQAIDLPRVFSPPAGPVEVESIIPAAVVADLARRGHGIAVPEDKPIGGAQAIWIDWDEGVLTGASEPRKDGCALGY